MLDGLVEQGVVDEETAVALRVLVPPPSDEPMVPEMMTLLMLQHAVLKPEKRETRAASQRAYAIAFLHAYYTNMGRQDATAQTAKDCKVSTKTVSNSVRSSPVLIGNVRTALKTCDDAVGPRSPNLRKMMINAVNHFPSPRRRNNKH